MYLWRNLPKGQLSAVLRWLSDARQPPASAASEQRPQRGLEASAVSAKSGSAPKA